MSLFQRSLFSQVCGVLTLAIETRADLRLGISVSPRRAKAPSPAPGFRRQERVTRQCTRGLSPKEDEDPLFHGNSAQGAVRLRVSPAAHELGVSPVLKEGFGPKALGGIPPAIGVYPRPTSCSACGLFRGSW